MPDRLNAAKQKAEHFHRMVLTVLPTRRHRETVSSLCRSIDPQCIVYDVSNVTDAVLLILAEPVDVLVVDVGFAGDLLGVLQHHLRRSAPKAKLALVRTDELAKNSAIAQRSTVLSLLELEGNLARMLLDCKVAGD